MHKLSHTNRQWQGKFFRCGMRCWYCLKPLSILESESEELATQDHLTPISKGGTDHIDNIVPACFACNRKKGEMTEEEFRRALSTAFEIVKHDVPIAGAAMRLDQRDEPCLAKLRQENEGVSWAWKNPA